MLWLVLVAVAAVAVILASLWRHSESHDMWALAERCVIAVVLFLLVLFSVVTGLVDWLFFAVLVLYAFGVLLWNFSVLGLFRSRQTVS